MTFEVLTTPDPKLAAVGDVLTLAQAAQLLELNASELRTRCAMAASVSCSGFKLRVKEARS